MNITNIKENIGNIDRIVRVLLAIFFIVAYLHGVISGVVGIILLAVAVGFLATAIFGYCIIYSLFGLSTKWKRHTLQP